MMKPHAIVATTVLTLASASSAPCQRTESLFDVSLSSSRVVDLSPYYQKVVCACSYTYRGDFPDNAVTVFTTHLVGDGFAALPQLQDGFDPFPAVAFTLREGASDSTLTQ